MSRPRARSALLLRLVVSGTLIGGAAAQVAQSPNPTTPALAASDIDLAVEAMQSGKLVRARALAEAVLAREPNSALAHYVLGVAMQDGEGNIPLALNLFQTARRLAERPDGTARAALEKWHQEILFRLMYAQSDLGDYHALLALTAEIRRLYRPQLFSADVWPLMKLGRIEEARTAAKLALQSGNPVEEAIARNGLCALDGYPACQAMLKAVRGYDLPPGLALRNTAIAAYESGRLAEAERLLLESTEYPEEEANPHRDLAMIYTAEGRLAEAAGAAREMLSFSRRLPRRQRQYSRGGELTTAAELLLVAGHADRALRAASRALVEPDRAAHWSGTALEVNAEAALLDQTARRTLAQQFHETAAVAPWSAALRLRAIGWSLSVSGWFSARRIMPLVLAGGLRPRETAEQRGRPQLSAPEWMLLDAIDLMGPGPALGLIEQLRSTPAPPHSPIPSDLRDGYFLALVCEAHALRGDDVACLTTGAKARELLPPGLKLLRTRLAARMAQAALRQGDHTGAWPLLDEVFAGDPGTLRRLDAALPVALDRTLSGSVADAAALVVGTGRFVEMAGSPFVLTASRDQLCLLGPGQGLLACAGDPGQETARDRSNDAAHDDRSTETTTTSIPELPRPGEFAAAERRIALAFLREAFAPRVDLSQSDLGSLDGSPTTQRGLDDDTVNRLLR